MRHRAMPVFVNQHRKAVITRECTRESSLNAPGTSFVTEELNSALVRS